MSEGKENFWQTSGAWRGENAESRLKAGRTKRAPLRALFHLADRWRLVGIAWPPSKQAILTDGSLFSDNFTVRGLAIARPAHRSGDKT
jgi:hypothetical protein